MIGFKPILAILFFCAVLGAAMVGVFVLPNQQPNERVRANQSFERTVAEGMRLYNPKTGVDIIRFDACRIEKLRIGVFILGAFDVLCLDGLVLNLPLPANFLGTSMYCVKGEMQKFCMEANLAGKRM